METTPKITIKPNPNGGVDITTACGNCGNPLIKTGKYGMDCVNNCVKKATLRAFKERPFLKKLFKMFNP